VHQEILAYGITSRPATAEEIEESKRAEEAARQRELQEQADGEEAKEMLDQQENERLFEDADADGLPEYVTDDEIFDESDFEIIQKTVDDDGNEKFWQVEESIDLEDENAPKRRILRDPGEPTAAEWEEHRIDHYPFRSWCPFCVMGRGTGI